MYRDRSRAQEKIQCRANKWEGGRHQRSLLSQEGLGVTRYFGGISRGGLRYMRLESKYVRRRQFTPVTRQPSNLDVLVSRVGGSKVK